MAEGLGRLKSLFNSSHFCVSDGIIYGNICIKSSETKFFCVESDGEGKTVWLKRRKKLELLSENDEKCVLSVKIID